MIGNMSSDLADALMAADLEWAKYRAVVVRAAGMSTDALMCDRPCICGKEHNPSTDCYMSAAKAALEERHR